MAFQTYFFCSYFIQIDNGLQKEAGTFLPSMSYKSMHIKKKERDSRRKGRADKDSIESETESHLVKNWMQ